VQRDDEPEREAAPASGRGDVANRWTSRSLYLSTSVETLRQHYPGNEVFQRLSDETRMVVSEPLGSLEGVWNEMPEASWGLVQAGEDELHRFEPRSG
jgi:glutamine amidotransferase